MFRFSLSGDYRALLVKAGDVTWSLNTYNNSEQVMLPSNADKVKQQLLKSSSHAVETVSTIENGTELALCIEFNLPSSSYATVFLVMTGYQTDRFFLHEKSIYYVLYAVFFALLLF
jgi:tRNA(Glu) U13 pseudouridine synthase TruD